VPPEKRGRFIWPSPANGVVAISAAQLAYTLDGIDPVPTQSLGVERHADAVMPDDLDQISTLHVIQHTDRNLSWSPVPGILSTVSALASTADRDAPAGRSGRVRRVGSRNGCATLGLRGDLYRQREDWDRCAD
jgi:hypothetical protein